MTEAAVEWAEKEVGPEPEVGRKPESEFNQVKWFHLQQLLNLLSFLG